MICARVAQIGFDLDSYEYIPRYAIADGVLTFLKYTNEKDVLADALLAIVRHLKPSLFFDVGAGGGCFLKTLCECMPVNYVAVEPNSELFRKLRSLAKAYKNKATVYNTTLEDFDTKLRFDLVFSCHTMSYFKSKEKALNKMLSILTPDGSILLVLHSEKSEQLRNCLNIILDKERKAPHLTAETFVSILRTRGYSPQLSYVDSSTRIPTQQDWHRLSYFLTRCCYEKLSEENKERFDRFFLEHRQHNGLEINTTHGLVLFNLCKGNES